MAVFSTSHTVRTVLLPPSHDISHYVSGQVSTSTHTFAAVTYGRQTAQIICHLGSDLAESHSYSASARKDPQQYWHLLRSGFTNTLIYEHTTPRILPTCDMSLGWLTVAMPEAGVFVELLETYLYLENLSFCSSHCGTVACNFLDSIKGKLMTLPFFKQNVYYKRGWI
jgi:hypothetical protein